MSIHPISDPLLWARWLLAAIVTIWLPGHLLVGRFLREQDLLSRCVVSIASGLLLVPLVGWTLANARLPLTPWTHLPTVLVLAVVLARTGTYRSALVAGFADLPALGNRARWVALGSIVLSAATIVSGFHDFVVPPHVHDASNHAYLTSRTVMTNSIDPRVLFSAEVGRPEVLYLAGWHAAAGLVARVGGIAPYVSTWMTAVAALVWIPVALSLLWRAWALPSFCVAAAMILVVGNEFAPGGALGWGGFGKLMGFLVLPTLVLVARGVLRAPTWAGGALLGLLLGALAQIHASEIALLPILLVPLVLAGRSAREGVRIASHARAWFVCIVVFAAFSGVLGWQLGMEYSARMSTLDTEPIRTLPAALERLLGAGGKSTGLKILAVTGVLLAFRGAAPAGVRWVFAGFALLFLAIATSRDPVTLLLSQPFHQQEYRVLYLQAYVLPPLMGLPLLALYGRARAHLGAPIASTFLAAAFVFTLAPALHGVVSNFRNSRVNAPFTTEAYHLASRIADHVDEQEIVANFRHDGSSWAMHVSGRRFLLPCSWELFDERGPIMDRVGGLLSDPWPPPSLGLRDMGVTHLWLNHAFTDAGHPDAEQTRALSSDPRFEVVLQGADVALYRIHWERGSPLEGETRHAPRQGAAIEIPRSSR